MKEKIEDCISRRAVRRVLSNEVFELMKLYTTNPEDNPKADAMAYGVNWSLNTLMELPSVTPQPKIGQWRHYEGMLICSECGAEYYDDIMEYCGDDVPKCCPDCGAYIAESEE